MKAAFEALATLLVVIVVGALLGLGIGATGRLIVGPPAPPPTCDPGYVYISRDSACVTGYSVKVR